MKIRSPSCSAVLAALLLANAGCGRAAGELQAVGGGAPEAGKASSSGGTPVAEKGPAKDAAASKVQVEILDYAGIAKRIAAHQGKVVVVDFWSTSCDPCKKEFPHLVALQQAHDAAKVACMSVSCDFIGLGKPEEIQPPVLEFLTAQKATFENFLSSTPDTDLYEKHLQIDSIPAVFVYGRDGKLARKFSENDIPKDAKDASLYTPVRKLVSELLAR